VEEACRGQSVTVRALSVTWPVPSARDWLFSGGAPGVPVVPPYLR